MPLPKVTVLMSVYNATEYLPQALKSICTQSFTDFEFLIIDDGSKEPLSNVLGAHKDERIRMIRHDNRGLTGSLNRGLRLARGEYVARMDADDVSVPQRLELQMAEMETDAGLDLVGSYFDVIDADNNLVERKEPYIDPIYRLWRLQFHNNYGHGSVMLRTESVIKAGMYDEDLRYAQDYDLWSRLSTKTNTKIVPRVLYRYRMIAASDQASVRNYNSQFANAIKISNRNLIACNPRLTEEDCAKIRSLYWRFQLEHLSVTGLLLVPDTLEGFCRRYAIEGEEQRLLISRVARDIIEEMDNSKDLTSRQRDPDVAKILVWCYTYTS
jgi:glycosyltransferase involved in cell wall biosynthesis